MEDRDVILKAENISKQYRLGVAGTGTISHDLNRFWYKIRGKEDPYLKIGETNDRSTKGESDYVWAIKDIYFDVKRGEVLGIIGKNGAGKSTLLKILSRVTGPTTGSIKTKGRIASLLEVGTGFHPEMTGRENVYLNGAILGMTKKEISSKIDEIIEFSGCERYIDTPTKRYSSGMTVRLAFAVAAFLEPDILVVDEVLAVGDAEFQKKAIGKMQDISNSDGRTVLFVSHNMAAIQDLCTSLLVVDNGKTVYEGNVSDGINFYLKNSDTTEVFKKFKINENTSFIKSFEIVSENEQIKSGDKIEFLIDVKVIGVILNPILSIRISDLNNVNIACWRSNNYIESPLKSNIKNDFTIKVSIDELFLLNGLYSVSLGFSDGKQVFNVEEKFITFEVFPSKPDKDHYNITKENSTNSLIYINAKWVLNER